MIKKVKKQDINQAAKQFADYSIDRLVSKIEANKNNIQSSAPTTSPRKKKPI
jgi:ribosomal protein S17E